MPETHDNTEFGKLVSVIESLQEQIKRDHATIGANETRTRNTLIDPLLKALGWADSSVITPEYLIRYGPRAVVADYALHAPGQRAQPIAFIRGEAYEAEPERRTPKPLRLQIQSRRSSTLH